MRSTAEYFGDRLNAVPDVGRGTGIFVTMIGPLAQVNIGDQTVTIPCIGFTPPVAGIAVQLERRRGQLAVFGPAVALPSMGTIKATGTPKCTVTVAGVDYVLGYRSGYSPAVGDPVEVNWATGIIQGKVTVAPDSTGPGTNPGGGATPLPTSPVLATGSGAWSFSYSNWSSNNPRASDHMGGAWWYGSRVKNALKGATVTQVEIYLPLVSQVGNATIGTHSYGLTTGWWTGLNSGVALSPRNGWVKLPQAFVTQLAAGGGIAVTSSDGDNNWEGTGSDSLSGALRFHGQH